MDFLPNAGCSRAPTRALPADNAARERSPDSLGEIMPGEAVRQEYVRFAALGYTVVAFTSSVEALAAFAAAPQAFDLVITDQTMLRLTGEDLVGEILRIRPQMPIILCTGFSQR